MGDSMITTLNVALYLILGVTAGTLSGILGIGGGIIIIPALVYIFHFTQHQAQGTTLALMIPPIGLMAAYVYYTKGYINIPVAAIICIGFFVGGFFGGKLACYLSGSVLQKIFAVLLMVISLKMFFQK
jgi:uncharacterized membrane protein YfcA